MREVTTIQKAIRNLYTSREGAIAYTAGYNGNGGILADYDGALATVREMGRHRQLSVEVIDTVEDMDAETVGYLYDAGYTPAEYCPCIRLEADELRNGYLTGLRIGILIGM